MFRLRGGHRERRCPLPLVLAWVPHVGESRGTRRRADHPDGVLRADGLLLLPHVEPLRHVPSLECAKGGVTDPASPGPSVWFRERKGEPQVACSVSSTGRHCWWKHGLVVALDRLWRERECTLCGVRKRIPY